MNLHIIDYLCIFVYLGFIIILGSSFARGQKTTKIYFLAGKSIHWLPLSMSMYASIFSAISFVMAPAEAFRGDLQYLVALALFPVASVIALIFFIDLYTRLQITTIYEYVEARFNRVLSYIVLSTFLIFRSLYAGIVIFTLSMVLHVSMDFPLLETMIGVGVGAVIYTTLGGIRAVIWTDVIQFIIIVGSLLVTLFFAAGKVPGGFSEIVNIAGDAGKLRLINTDFDLTHRYIFWTLILYGFVEFLGAKTVDQMNVQRYLSAKNARNAKIAMFAQSFFTLPVWLLLFGVGMSLYAYYQYYPSLEVAGFIADGKYDRILPQYIGTVLPTGIRGLLIAALMAAAMSTMDSVLNALSTISVVNIYMKIKPKVSDKQALKMAKILTVFWGIIVTFLAWLMIDIQSILVTIQSIAGILIGPILGIFVLGMFTQRSNWQGALAGLITALVPLIIMKYGPTILLSFSGLFGWDIPIPSWLSFLNKVTFTVYGIIGLIISTTIGYVFSWLFHPPDENIKVLLWKARGWKEMLLGNPDEMIDISNFLDNKHLVNHEAREAHEENKNI
jgi:sodium-coupled monocarboxylate transporter 8/12